LWINNLAAPDMTLWWTEKIPYVSTPDDIGSFLYLGPYLNVLPLLAVGLMIWQQSKMMPPKTDENAPDPKTMMKIMMVMMAVMFYKVAAGLALYFIVGSSWGMAERRYFVKHPPPPTDEGGTPAGTPPKADSPNGQPTTPEEEKAPGMLGRLREAMMKRLEEAKKQADEQSKRQIRNDPDKKHDRKKKRRK
jgi:YidC/Oxa1 family membrane protein insertase